MANRFHFVQADNKVRLQVTCTDSAGAAINLSGASVNLRWRKKSDGLVENRAMTIDNAASGVVSYLFLTGELVPPTMEYEVTVTKADGTVISSLDTEVLGIRTRLVAV